MHRLLRQRGLQRWEPVHGRHLSVGDRLLQLGVRALVESYVGFATVTGRCARLYGVNPYVQHGHVKVPCWFDEVYVRTRGGRGLVHRHVAVCRMHGRLQLL